MTSTTPANQTPPGPTAPIALLVGASRGLGLEIARDLSARGHRVVLAARDADELAGAASQVPGALTEVLDITDAQAVQDVVDRVEREVGPIDVAISVAGIIQVGPAADMTLEHFDQAIDIMAKGPLHLAWAVLPAMRRRHSGHIGVVSSVGGVVAPPHLLPYSMAKFAALGFSDGLAAELAGSGVTCTSIVPGLMRTGSQGRAVFTGNAAAEHAWFAVAASLPLLSMDATVAARRIVDAVMSGSPLVALTPLTWAAYRVRGLAPATTTRLMGLTGRLLPRATGNSDTTEGRDLPTNPVVHALTVLGRRAAARNNER